MITVLLALLLALVPMPLLRSIRGSSTSFPRLRITLGILWLTWVLLIVVLGLNSPWLLHGLALILVMPLAALGWRGRASYGRSSGMPAGSLALSESLLAIVDRDYYLRAAERYGPVFKMAQFHQPTICVIGLERGHRLFREHRDSFGPVSQPFNRSVAGGFLRYMDPDTHGVYARLFGRALALPVVADAVPDIEDACQSALATMAGACLAEKDSATSPRIYCEQISYDAFVRVLFGLTPGTPAYEEMESAYASGLDTYNIGSRADASTERSLEHLRSFLRDHAESLINDPAKDPGCTLSALHRLDENMPDAVCMDNLLFILKISTANVASLVLWLFKMLGEHPEWMRRIEQAGRVGDKEGQVAVIDSVTKETLRLVQSEYLYRRLLEDVEYEGMTLPRGWLVRLCVRESHLSEVAFVNPAQFDPDRFLHGKSGVTEYAPFGYGAHGCNGIALTDAICRAFLQTLASGFDWRIAADGHLERGFRHWSHWQPSSDLRIRMRARQPVG